MKYLILALFITLPSQLMAWSDGRLPTDPAILNDVYNVERQVGFYQILNQDKFSATSASLDSLNSKVDTFDSRINDLNKLKLQIGSTVRLYDAKCGSLNFFSFTDIQGSGGNALGLNIGIKLGKSYEQRLIEKQQKQIDFLLEKLRP